MTEHNMLSIFIQENPSASFQNISWQHLNNGDIRVSYQLADSTDYSITLPTPASAATEILYRTRIQNQNQL